MSQLGFRELRDGDAEWLARCAPSWIREPPTRLRWMQALSQGLPGAAVAVISNTPFALLHLGNLDAAHRRASVQMWAPPDARGSSALAAALEQWVEATFVRWPLHRLTLEWCDDERPPPGLDDVFRSEGCMVRQRWAAGAWRDVTLWARLRTPSEAPASSVTLGGPRVVRPSRSHHSPGSGSRRPSDTQPLRGRLVTLRAIAAEDEPFLHRLATRPEVLHRWRAGSELPDAEQYAIWRRTNNAVDVIAETHEGRPVGELVLYGWERLEGVAYLGCAFLPETWGTPVVIDALRAFLRYCFDVAGLRKLCLEIPEWNLDRLSSGLGRVLDVEAIQVDHLWRGGRPQAQVVAALWPEAFRRRDGQRQ